MIPGYLLPPQSLRPLRWARTTMDALINPAGQISATIEANVPGVPPVPPVPDLQPVPALQPLPGTGGGFGSGLGGGGGFGVSLSPPATPAAPMAPAVPLAPAAPESPAGPPGSQTYQPNYGGGYTPTQRPTSSPMRTALIVGAIVLVAGVGFVTLGGLSE